MKPPAPGSIRCLPLAHIAMHGSPTGRKALEQKMADAHQRGAAAAAKTIGPYNASSKSPDLF
jgi:hypothetical protein